MHIKGFDWPPLFGMSDGYEWKSLKSSWLVMMTCVWSLATEEIFVGGCITGFEINVDGSYSSSMPFSILLFQLSKATKG